MNAPPPPARAIPAEIQSKYDAWKYWANVWTIVHYVVGSSAAGLSALIAADAHAGFSSPGYRTGAAALTAACTFFLTAISPQKIAKGFVNAHRHLEKAMARYRFDPQVDEKTLARAEEEGLNFLG